MSNTIKDTNSSKPVLIFPGGMPRSIEFLQKCLRTGQAVIGASSLDYDVSREQYPEWLFLPFVVKPDFDNELKQAILRFNIGGVFTPNPVVWSHLNQVLKEIAPHVQLVNDSPVDMELSAYRDARVRARALLNSPLSPAANSLAKAPMSEIELAALFRHANSIPGNCDDEKISALCQIAGYCPPGDIVEIGSWWGKSAFVFARLARCYEIGSLLCVDPWTNKDLIQNDVSGMVDEVYGQLDVEEALLVFEMNLLPYSFNHVNYLRMRSVDGAERYRANRDVTTKTFGTTNYCGHIAMLHIDGNHSYAAVKADIKSWCSLVCPSGWIVLDDYVWPYEDGPQRAGDEFLFENKDRIDVAFVMGSALFIQLCAAL